MDNTDLPNSTNDPSTGETPEVEELSHSDKLVGVFAEPKTTFEKISGFPPKTIDWILPVILLLVVIALTRILVLSNDEIAYQTKQTMRQQMEQQMSDRVESGSMTQENADNIIDKQIEFSFSPMGKIIQAVSILIGGFIFFFIITGIYFLFARFLLKGEGKYSTALVPNGLVAYISIVQILVATVLSLLMGKLLGDVSIASFTGADKATIAGFILGKLDIFSIWIYAVLSIGLAKMFKSETVGKYYIMVFGLWIIGGLIIFALGQALPFLRGFGG
jgi:hypothetical protein